MNTDRLVRFIAVGIVLLLVVSIVEFFLYRVPTRSLPNEADINAIY
jgi:hypothetical protein